MYIVWEGIGVMIVEYPNSEKYKDKYNMVLRVKKDIPF